MRLVGGQVVAPLLGLGDAFEQAEATLHQGADVGHHDEPADERTEPTEGEREAKFVGEEDGAVSLYVEGVVVLKGFEAARDHGVLKEGVRVEAADEAVVELREAELPALPEDLIAADDEAGGAAGDGVHAELFFHDGDAGGEEETAVERGLDDGLIAEREHSG